MKRSNKLAVLLGATAMSLGALALTGCSVKAVDYGYSLDMTADTRGASIDFWAGFGTNINSVIETMITDFTKLTGITVNYQSQGSYDALQNAINLSASTGTYPNVAVGYPDHFAGYIYSDIQLPLNFLIDNDKNIPAKQSNGDAELAKFDYSDFYASYKTENESLKSDANGNAYVMGLPFNKSTEVMVYNKTFFESSLVKGYNNGSIVLPTTWAQAENTAKEILAFVKHYAAYGKVLGNDGVLYVDSSAAKAANTTVVLDLSKVAEGKLHPLTYDSTANWFITGARQWGGTYTTLDAKTGNGYIGFKNDGVKNFLTDMVDNGRANGFGVAADWGANYCSDYFKTYQTVMNVGSSAGVSYVQPTGGVFEPAVAPIPYKDADKKFVISQGTNMCMFNKGNDVQKLATWKFVKYMTQIANGTFAASTGYFPTCKTAYNSADYQAMLAKQTTMTEKLAVEAAKVNNDDYSAENGWTKFVDPGFVGSSTVRTSITTVIPEMFIDKKSYDTVMEEQYTALKDYVAA